MRVVLATPYKICNYGAMLQAWALKYILESMGHEVKYLNCRYMWPGIFGWRKILFSKSLGGMRNKIRINHVMRSCIEELHGFSETRPYDTLSDLIRNPPDCDCLMSGSDQIFGANYFIERKRYLPVLLGFGRRDIRRVVYGGSFGTPNYDQLMINDEIRDCFARISSIGLREHSGIDILRKLTGLEGCWTPDPTFLLSKEEYCAAFKIAATSRCHPYICAYMLGWVGRDAIRDKACKDAMERFGGKEIHVIHGDISVAQWLDEIAHASCIVTNSFHGHCFSLIFNKPCVVLGFDGEESWRNERNDDLLRTCRTLSLPEMAEAGRSYLKKCLQ